MVATIRGSSAGVARRTEKPMPRHSTGPGSSARRRGGAEECPTIRCCWRFFRDELLGGPLLGGSLLGGSLLGGSLLGGSLLGGSLPGNSEPQNGMSSSLPP